MTKSPDFQPVFERLREILKPYASDLTITQNTSDFYSLDGHYSQKFKRNLFFGSAQIKKNYVSFYLMPVYMYPEMLETIFFPNNCYTNQFSNNQGTNCLFVC